jgi:signal transduction histidine kinase
MAAMKPRLRNLFAEPFSAETVRAFVVFAFLFVALAGIAGQLAFGELSLKVMEKRANLGRSEAERVAEAVAALGREEGVINFHLLRQKKVALQKVIGERIAARPYIRRVEVLDRFGAPLLQVRQESLRPPTPGFLPRESGEGEQGREIKAELVQGPPPHPEVRIEISDERLQQELSELRRSLRIKAAVATAFGLGVLIVGFFYVLHLIRKNRQLEQSRLAAERRSYVGLLASGLAHEIRNPLNAMNMNLQMLEEELQAVTGSEGEEYRELLGSTMGEIKRLESLAKNFLTYARPPRPRFESRDLNEVLQEVILFLQADFNKSGVTLVSDLEPMLPSVELDETLLRQAVMNLLVNAHQVLGSGGAVRLSSRAGSSGEVVVEVEDDGPGMSDEKKEKVFEVFYSSRQGGTGLGLPIARQIVERHGGTIEVESTVGVGTTFRIHLPRRQVKPSGEETAGEGK